MLKILAPTDFSANSRAGLRFALQWSVKQKLAIQFVHFFHPIRLPEWTDLDFQQKVEIAAALYQNKLEQFVRAIYKSTKIVPGKYSCIARYGLSADIAIMDYCRDHVDIDFICIATRGAGKLNKLLGTNTGNLTIKSRVPVITVPKNYRIKPLKSILYATDFNNYTEELKKVIAFARPLEAKIKVLHFSRPDEEIPNLIMLKKRKKERLHSTIEIQIKKRKSSQSLLEDLQKQISILKPSLIVMFTNQHRNFFQKILSPSKAEQISFGTTFPLLSFNKQ
jgi:nucleotide-binding universal stress UspA family protein